MYCPACGERNANGARVCAACGVELPVDVVSAPAPAPAQIPQILKSPLSRPAPLRPPSLEPLPPSGRSTPHVVPASPPPLRQTQPASTSAPPQVQVRPDQALASVASAPVVRAPVVPVPVVPAPVVTAPVVPPPVVTAPVVTAPVVRAPVVPAPVAPAPVVRAPGVPAPVVPAPVVRAPIVTAPVVPAPVVPVTRVASPPATSVFDAHAPTVIEEFREDTDSFDSNEVTDPGQPHFDDDDGGVDVSFTSRTGEGIPVDGVVDVDGDAHRSLPRMSSRAPSVGRYALAALVDGVLAGGPALALALMVGGDANAPFLERVIQAILLTPSSLVVFVVTAIVLSTLHHALLVPRVGGTVGGILTGVFLRTPDGQGATTPRAIIRGVVTAASALAFLAGPLYALWVDDHRRALADRLAGTRLVIREHA